MICQPRLIASVGSIHDIYLVVLKVLLCGASSIGVKSYLCTIRRPARVQISCSVICKPSQSSTISVHDIYVSISVYITLKGNLCTIRRPARVGTICVKACQPSLITTISIHDVYFLVAISLTVKDYLIVWSRKCTECRLICLWK